MKYIEKFRQQLKESAARTYFSRNPSTTGVLQKPTTKYCEDNYLMRHVAASTTPPGSPPPGLPGSAQNPAQPPTTQAVPPQPGASGTNIMEVLASIAKQSAAPGPPSASATPPVAPSASTPAPPAPVHSYGAPSTLPYQAPTQQPYSAPGAPASLAASMPGFPAQLLASLGAPSAPSGYPSAIPQAAPPPSAPAPGPPGGAAPGINQVMLIKTLIDQGLQPDQISAILQTMSGPQGAPQGPPAYPAAPTHPQEGGWAAAPQGRDFGQGDRQGYGDRSRSRSPDRWGRDGRGGYDRHGSGRRDGSRDRGRGGRPDYRHRSPMGRRGTPDHGHEKKQKWVEYDRSLRPNTIKGTFFRSVILLIFKLT